MGRTATFIKLYYGLCASPKWSIDMSIQQNTLLKFLPGPGPSKCPWAWAWVAVKIISVLYHDFVLNIKIHLLEIYVSFLQTDGSWLKTMPRILTAAHMKHQSKKHQAVSQTLLSHPMCQAFRFMSWAATRCAEHLLFKMLGGLERPEIRRCWEV